jgi:alpha-glucosidase
MVMLDGRSLGKNPTVRNISLKTIKDSIISPIPEKRKIIRNEYTEMVIAFKQPFSLEVRAFNDGVAYRLLTQFRDSVFVKNELAQFNFADNFFAWYPEMQKRPDMDIFHTSYEEPYQFKRLDSISADKIFFTPILVDCENGIKALITESDIEDYPGMFLKGTGGASLESIFAGYPAEEAINGGEYPQVYVTQRTDYIAHTLGRRHFPWRVIALSGSDKEIPSNDIVYRLASPSRIADPSWIHPGKGTDEWIIGINLFNVPFVASIKSATYKYYIDFAKIRVRPDHDGCGLVGLQKPLQGQSQPEYG